MRNFVAFGVAALAVATVNLPAWAQDWAMVKDESSVVFEVTQLGTPIQGTFGIFDADIIFDPNALDQSAVTVTIDLASVDTANGERDAEIRGPVWFDSGNHPNAVFQSTSFESNGDRYAVAGELTIRGITKPVVLDVAINVDGGAANAEGVLQLVRTDFEVGTGQWATDATIGMDVTLTFAITASAAG